MTGIRQVGRKETRRRTSGVRVNERTAEVVSSVLGETVRQLARDGYAALNVDAIALAVGVNKTTIYRRWPTKPQLVAAALESFSAGAGLSSLPDLGDLRAELLELLRRTLAKMATPEGRGLNRVMHTDCPHEVLECIVRDLRAQRRALGIELIRRAAARGEVPRDIPAAMMIDLLTNTVNARARVGGRLPAGFLESLVDVVVAGGVAVANGAARRPGRLRTGPTRRG